MLEILIGGKPLWIAEGTAITMEQSSSLFDIDNMCSEVVWTFDVPAGRNAELLGQVHYSVVGAYRSYGCQLRYDGVLFGSGRLYVQVVTDEETVSCGVVVSDVAEGWGERLLRDDEGWERREIATSLAEHEAGWKEFLKESAREDSDTRFFLFADDEFTDDEEFGYYANRYSSLQDVVFREDADDCYLFTKWVNRLFFDGGMNPIDNTSNTGQGMRVFNRMRLGGKSGGYHFCPALRLERLVRTALAATGYTAVGNFLADARVRRLFHQSLNAMDGDVTQYGYGGIEASGASGGRYDEGLTDAAEVVVGGERCNVIELDGTAGSLAVNIYLDVSQLARGQEVTGEAGAEGIGFDLWDEAYYLLMLPADRDVPEHFWLWRDSGGWAYMIGSDGVAGTIAGGFGTGGNPFQILNMQTVQDVEVVRLTGTEAGAGLDSGGWVACQIDYGRRTSLSGGYRVVVVKVKVRTTAMAYIVVGMYQAPGGGYEYGGDCAWRNDRSRLEWVTVESAADLGTEQAVEAGFNIYKREYREADYVPEMTNSDFLKTLARTFGLAVWFAPFGKRVEMSFFADMVDAGALDVTEWVVGEKKEAYAEGHYEVVLPTVRKQQDMDERRVGPEVATRAQLPAARGEKNRAVMVKAENAYHVSVKMKRDERYGFEWDLRYGNDARLVVGDETAEMVEVKPNVKIPNMRVVDGNGTAKYVMEVPQKGGSPLLDADYDGRCELILTQDTGRGVVVGSDNDYCVRQMLMDGDVEQPLLGGIGGVGWIEPYREAMYCAANPTCYNADGSVEEGMITLAAAGERSVGELWLRELYDFLAHKETFELVLRLPVTAFLRLHRLMEPQEGEPREQERWIYYKGRRFLPSRISYQFRSGLVEATVTCHRRHLGE